MKCDDKRFIPDGDKALRVPFTALGGLGEAAAQGIVEARSEPFISVEDLKIRGKASSAVIDLFTRTWVFKGFGRNQSGDAVSILGVRWGLCGPRPRARGVPPLDTNRRFGLNKKTDNVRLLLKKEKIVGF